MALGREYVQRSAAVVLLALAWATAGARAATPAVEPVRAQPQAAAPAACRSMPRPGTNDDVALAALPDGTVWYGDRRGNRLVRVGADGRREPLVPGDGGMSALSGIAIARDGSLWYTKDSSNRIGRISPQGEAREFAAPESGAFPAGLVVDRAGRLWFHSRVRNYIGLVHENGGARLFRGPVALSTGFAPHAMTLGADGNLWITDRGHNAIYRFEVESRQFTRFDIPTPRAEPGSITAGADGDVWFTLNARGRVGRITPAGHITEIDLGDVGGAALRGIVGTPDGSVWVTTRGSYVARILPDGAVRRFRCGSGLGTALVGPGGAPWFFDDEKLWVVESAKAPTATAR